MFRQHKNVTFKLSMQILDIILIYILDRQTLVMAFVTAFSEVYLVKMKIGTLYITD